MIRLKIVAVGNHNNLHFHIRVGTKKNPFLKLKMVGFPDHEVAMISHVISNVPVKYLDKKLLFNKISEEVKDKLDLDFVILSEKDWENRGEKTEELIKKFENLKVAV